MILNINKPLGITSFKAIKKLKGVLKVKKIGHAGTLDPLAEGVLIVLTDADTKKQQEIVKLQKEYIAKVVFGVTSPTYDMEKGVVSSFLGSDLQGEGLKYLHSEEFKAKVQNSLQSFVGEIHQEVPPYSAVKVKGKPLYKYARSASVPGFALPVKVVSVKSIKIIGWEVGKFEVEVDVNGNTAYRKLGSSEVPVGVTLSLPVALVSITCSSGTYVRSIAHELGRNLGTGGALFALVRSRVGDYTLEDALELETFLKKV